MPSAIFGFATQPTIGQALVWNGRSFEPGNLAQAGANLTGFGDNRIAFGNTTGGLEDSSALTFDGTILTSTGGLRASTDSQALEFTDTLGEGGRRFRIAPRDAATSSATSSLELVPGTLNASGSSIPSQLQLFNKVGANYERFDFSCVNNQYFIDSTRNGTGTARNIYFQMGGSISPAITGQNAIAIYADASVDLMGSGSYSASGLTWAATRTRVADIADTGSSRLIIDTRTTTPASNVADSCGVEYRRGGSMKWLNGLNMGGGGADAYDWYNGSTRMSLSAAGALSVGAGATVATSSGTLTVGGSSNGGVVNLNAAATTQRGFYFQTAGVTKLQFVSSGTESGGDAGCNLQIVARTDAGALIDAMFEFYRVAGAAVQCYRPFVSSGKISGPAATTATASVRLPHGTAPTTPVDGDMWTTTAGIYVRINGATVGPLT